ncbi:cyclic nucleotide-binding domain-containing protein [Nostoc sp. NMS8]|uniref:cyclic nucleotide-binding domain-containing protein n=1 Tax=Nostoc sp. NMS8 TaxID=2815392 RepID=UPI0025E2D8B7|nr:cyclic nucleotide-binding domain-containing protein [Nostoc sp. NMS8]MBN3958736.1 cyclic nucleotide-binding domain-containing protein [Nostoc sp. NMS8]
MTEVLLKELSNQDIDWMLAAGHQVEIESGTILIQQGQPLEALHILLDGGLTVSLTQPDTNPLGRAFAALEGGTLPGREIARLASGEMVGEIPFIETYLPSTTVRATTKSLVLTIPRNRLIQKLHQDLDFAAHLYRASAVLLANRLEQIMNQLGRSTVILTKPQLREALIIFAELHDSDIEWLIAAGRVQQIAADTVLIRSGRPIEALHILLDGAVGLNAAAAEINPLARAFSNLEGSQQPLEQEFARLSRGDILGETPFLEVQPPAVTVKAVRDSRVLSIPRWRLAAKLLHDVGFAVRFYRVLAILLADKQAAIVQRLGYGRLTYSSGQSLHKSYANELNSDFLTQVALAGARFEWMLKQIGID